ncbi:MAG: hypothetical protein AAGH78_17045 [Cyanobacteria bacterium P01_H01_bin.58]
MTSATTALTCPEAEALVAEVVAAFQKSAGPRPSTTAVTAALLAVEKAAKETRQAIAPASLCGTWRLCFSAGKKARYHAGQPTGNGFYVPKIAIAQITFAQDLAEPHHLTVANELRIGPLHLRFTGPARYPGKKNLLVFDFTHLAIRCFGLRLYQGAVAAKKYQEQSFEETAIAKLPFFAFFAATDTYIAARGRGGGLAIWVSC